MKAPYQVSISGMYIELQEEDGKTRKIKVHRGQKKAGKTLIESFIINIKLPYKS